MGSDQAIILVQRHPDEWRARFVALRDRIRAVVAHARIEHIGSTAVAGMPAKDVVDVLVGVPADAVDATVERLVADGWDHEGGRPGHAWLSVPNRYARDAVVHVVVAGSAQWRHRITFRDLLRESADAREQYLRVKECAAARSAGWGDYTAAKAGTVASLLEADRVETER